MFTNEEIEKFQEHVMFPMEKSALLNTIARQMSGQEDIQSEAIKGILTEKTIWHIIQHGWDIFIEKLIACGSISAAIIMVIIIGQAIKLIIDTIIRGYTLHAIYGFSIHIVGAIFSSITHLLIQLGNKESFILLLPKPPTKPGIHCPLIFLYELDYLFILPDGGYLACSL